MSNNETIWTENASEYQRYVVTVVYCITAIAAIFGNSLVFFSIFKYPSLQRKIYILIVSLAVSDFLVGLIAIPYELTFLYLNHQVTSKYGCLFRFCLPIIFLGASVWSLFCISFERFLAIVYPFTHVGKVTTNVLCVAVICCWVSAILIGVLPITGWNIWDPVTKCEHGYVLPVGYIRFVYGIYSCCLTCNFIMYIKVVKTAWKRLKKRTVNSYELKINQVFQQREKNRTRLTIIVLGVFAFCWFPYLVILFFRDLLGHQSHMYIALRTFFRSLAVLNSGLNWIVYGSCNKEMRNAFIRTVKCGKIKCEPQSVTEVCTIMASTKL